MATKKASNSLTCEATATAKAVAYANNTFEMFFEVDEGTGNKKEKVAKPVVQNKVMDEVLEEGDKILAEYNDYHENLYERSNAVLNDVILPSIYGLAKKIDAMPIKDAIVKKMSDRVNDASGQKKKVVTSKTPFMTVIVKYVVRTDRQSAHNYSRALRAAMEDKVSVENLPKYIKEKGGLAKITLSGTAKEKNKLAEQKVENRIDLVRCWMRDYSIVSGYKLDGNAPVVQLPVDETKKTEEAYKEGRSMRSDFVVFFAHYDSSIDTYLIGGGFDLGRPVEDYLIRYISKRIKTNDEKMKQIADEKSQEADAYLKQWRLEDAKKSKKIKEI